MANHKNNPITNSSKPLTRSADVCPRSVRAYEGFAKPQNVILWLQEEYFRSIQELAETGAKEILRADDSEAIRAILSVIAIAKGLRTHGKFLVEYSEDELLEMESR